jgi:hypothetical protein
VHGKEGVAKLEDVGDEDREKVQPEGRARDDVPPHHQADQRQQDEALTQDDEYDFEPL